MALLNFESLGHSMYIQHYQVEAVPELYYSTLSKSYIIADTDQDNANFTLHVQCSGYEYGLSSVYYHAKL